PRGAAPPDEQAPAAKGWEWLVGAVLIFLLAALVAVTHDPTRARVGQWIDQMQQRVVSMVESQTTVTAPVSPEEAAPADENQAAGGQGDEQAGGD
ncbi:hypothetical protein H0Z60_13135, partial [Ectothiorhodospiraceae bacterium WFHF3C12]|nr:hypothetical protein [Ectothiorhodospiraceae bacterium WFHF3C12]